jgi:hypothetical protein
MTLLENVTGVKIHVNPYLDIIMNIKNTHANLSQCGTTKYTHFPLNKQELHDISASTCSTFEHILKMLNDILVRPKVH